MPNSPEQWFKNLTPIAKTWLSLAVIATAGTGFGLIPIEYIYFSVPLVLRKFQIWRLITNFLYFGKFSIGWFFQMFILSRYTQLLEEQHFPGPRGTAELVFLLLFGAISLLLLNWMFMGGSIPFMASGLSFVLMYVWSRKSPFTEVSFWGFGFKAWHLPFVITVFHVLLGSSPMMDIFGIFVGHLYHFLMDIVPKVYNKELLKCPQFLYRIFDKTEVRNDWRGGAAHRLT
jgi:Derlin-2/3